MMGWGYINYWWVSLESGDSRTIQNEFVVFIAAVIDENVNKELFWVSVQIQPIYGI